MKKITLVKISLKILKEQITKRTLLVKIMASGGIEIMT
jgi:hypothetical protein